MSKVVDGFPGNCKGRITRYPWDQWLDGQTWELTPGEDFGTSVATFRRVLHSAATARGRKYITRLNDGKLYIQAIGGPAAR